MTAFRSIPARVFGALLAALLLVARPVGVGAQPMCCQAADCAPHVQPVGCLVSAPCCQAHDAAPAPATAPFLPTDAAAEPPATLSSIALLPTADRRTEAATGLPEYLFSFAEAVLQHSLLSHAPPRSAC